MPHPEKVIFCFFLITGYKKVIKGNFIFKKFFNFLKYKLKKDFLDFIKTMRTGKLFKLYNNYLFNFNYFYIKFFLVAGSGIEPPTSGL